MCFESRSCNSKCSLWVVVVVWLGAAALEGLWASFVLPTSLSFQPSFFFHNLLALVIHSFSCGSKDTLVTQHYTEAEAIVTLWPESVSGMETRGV